LCRKFTVKFHHFSTPKIRIYLSSYNVSSVFVGYYPGIEFFQPAFKNFDDEGLFNVEVPFPLKIISGMYSQPITLSWTSLFSVMGFILSSLLFLLSPLSFLSARESCLKQHPIRFHNQHQNTRVSATRPLKEASLLASGIDPEEH